MVSYLPERTKLIKSDVLTKLFLLLMSICYLTNQQKEHLVLIEQYGRRNSERFLASEK